jgi:molybdopterin converting factor subunit 1
MVLVRFFAGFKEKVNREFIEIPLSSKTTLREFVGKLGDNFPDVGKLLEKSQATIAVNHEVVEPDHIIKEGDEVAIFPPVSGG